MVTGLIRNLTILVTSSSLLLTTFIGAANAAMVGTDPVVNTASRAEQVSDIRGWLAEREVRDQLVAMGVDPADASQRITGMTDAEIHELHERIGELPAGAGAIEVIGIVFVVLLILELVGVTHIFSGF